MTTPVGPPVGRTGSIRQRVGNVLAVLGVVAIFLAVQPYYLSQGGTVADAAMAEHLRANPGDMPWTEEYRFGWAGSPLVHYRSERTLARREDGKVAPSRTTRLDVGRGWWSVLTLLIGIALVWAARRLRRPAAAGPGRPTAESTPGP